MAQSYINYLQGDNATPQFWLVLLIGSLKHAFIHPDMVYGNPMNNMPPKRIDITHNVT